MSEPSNYGRYYWCIILSKPTTGKKKNESIHLYADIVRVDGPMIRFIKTKGDLEYDNFAIHSDFVKCYYAASVLDGGAVAVEHWD